MDQRIYIVTTQDGKKLAMLQLVVPGEKRITRWLRRITGLKIKQAIKTWL